jgi:hypothetical protein
MIRGPRPLRDHVLTVSAYLNDYKCQTDREKQHKYSSKFTCYIISTCWPKMVRRISSWQAMGFMFRHKSIYPENLQMFGQNWDGFPSAVGPGDRTLIKFLEALRKDNLEQSLIYDQYVLACPDSEELSDFPLIFENVSSPDCLQRPVFSRETIVEFHKLTISAFNGFASSLIKLKEASGKLVGIDYLVAWVLILTIHQD